jgi:hypothetical protein
MKLIAPLNARILARADLHEPGRNDGRADQPVQKDEGGNPGPAYSGTPIQKQRTGDEGNDEKRNRAGDQEFL